MSSKQSQYRGEHLRVPVVSVRIILTRRGVVLAAASIAIALLGALTLRYEYVTMSSALAFVLLLDAIYVLSVSIRVKKSGSFIERVRVPERIVLGSEAVMRVVGSARGASPRGRLVLEDTVPPSLKVVGKPEAVARGNRVELEYVIRALYRGSHLVGPVKMSMPSPNDLLRVDFITPPVTHVYIDAVPTFYALEVTAPATKIRYPSPGAHTVRVKGAGAEFFALREYVPGDDVRLIHWGVTARNPRRVPIVREVLAESMFEVFVVLDPGPMTRAGYAEGRRIIDDMVDAAGAVVTTAMKKGDPVGLYLTGVPALAIPPTRRFERIIFGLKHLEKVGPSPETFISTGSLPDVVGRFVKRGSLVLVISLLDSIVPSRARKMAMALRGLGVRAVFVMPYLPKYAEAAAGEYLSALKPFVEEERKRVAMLVRALREGGAEVALHGPDTLVYGAVASYMAMGAVGGAFLE